MPSLKQVKTLPFSAKQLYDLVLDIEQYPKFLPWCRQAKITKNISENNLEAVLLVSFKNFLEKYTSDVKFFQKNSNEYFVDVKAVEGPFKKLVNQWKLRDLEDKKCEVEFFLDFEFNSFILSKMFGAVFSKASEKMMNAFEERAKEIYKKNI